MADNKTKMTIKQKAFCEYYLQNPNATEAAKKAGYSFKTANKIATENLSKPVIKAYLKERVDKIQDKRIAKSNEVLEYLTSVMRGETLDQFGLDAAITDRTKAAELLGKRYRLFTDKVEMTGTTTVVFESEEELED